jgi:hypothetical protein
VKALHTPGLPVCQKNSFLKGASGTVAPSDGEFMRAFDTDHGVEPDAE